MKPFALPLIIVSLVFTGLLYFLKAPNPPPVISSVMDFGFKDLDSTEIRSNFTLGKPSVWSFFFASCQGPCPALQAKVASLQQEFSSDKLNFVSISIDPLRDSPEILRNYAGKLGANLGNWKFLLPSEVEQLSEFAKSSFHAGLDLAGLVHSNRLFLVDGQNVLRGSYNSSEEEQIKQLRRDLRYLIQN